MNGGFLLQVREISGLAITIGWSASRRIRSIVGKKILVNNYPMTIVGVSAPGFVGLDPSHAPNIRIPIQMKP